MGTFRARLVSSPPPQTNYVKWSYGVLSLATWKGRTLRLCQEWGRKWAPSFSSHYVCQLSISHLAHNACKWAKLRFWDRRRSNSFWAFWSWSSYIWQNILLYSFLSLLRNCFVTNVAVDFLFDFKLLKDIRINGSVPQLPQFVNKMPQTFKFGSQTLFEIALSNGLFRLKVSCWAELFR